VRSETLLVERARSGDEAAFREISEMYRRELEAHCYRMLGSLADAEDALQDTLVRAWKGLAGFEGRASLRTWLYRIASNACIDLAARRPARSMPDRVGPPLAPGTLPAGPVADPIWLDPAPADLLSTGEASPEARVSARQSVEVAFMTVLHELPAAQRAVLLLREVIGFSAAETAELLDSTVAAVNSSLQRARATLDQRRGPPRAALDDEEARALLRRYIEAWESGAPDMFAALLRDDAILTMPPMAAWFAGAAAIGGFVTWLRDNAGPARLRPVDIAGGTGAGVYLRAPGDPLYRPAGLHVIEWAGDRVAAIHAFLRPDLFARFGLPAELTP